MNQIKTAVRNELTHFKILMRSVPAPLVSAFCVSVVLMNLLANKQVDTGLWWFALDCGLFISWMSFLAMDVITKRFGPGAAIRISIFAIATNLVVSFFTYLISMIPGNWSSFYDTGLIEVNDGLNAVFGGTWFVLLGSTIAMLVSSVVNSIVNHNIGKLFKTTSKLEFAARSYISTFIGQFIDNLVFSFIVSHTFFGWSTLQCIVCALTGGLFELGCEILFSPFGYRMCRQWEQENVGNEYIGYLEEIG